MIIHCPNCDQATTIQDGSAVSSVWVLMWSIRLGCDPQPEAISVAIIDLEKQLEKTRFELDRKSAQLQLLKTLSVDCEAEE